MDMPIKAQMDTRLSVGARFVLCALWRYATPQGRFVWPSKDLIASETGYQMRTLRGHLRALEQAGWIVPKRAQHDGWILCEAPGVTRRERQDLAADEDGTEVEDRQDPATERQEPAADRQEPAGKILPMRRDPATKTAGSCTPTTIKQPMNTLLGESGKISPPITEADREAHVRRVIGHFREQCQWELRRPKPPGAENILGILTVGERHLRELIEMGETADSLIATATKVRDQVESGELPPKFWGPLSFTGFYGALRDGQPIDGISKPAKGPSVDTAAEARAWAAQHDGRLPSDWEWQPDGHGHHEPVRRRGA